MPTDGTGDNFGASAAYPINGTLYKCTSTNTWTSYYTPYTYPHPLITALSDTTAPTVTAFTIPSTAASTTVSITTFTATDNISVTAYLLTETASTPASTNPNWSGTVPTAYTFTSAGSKTLYAWAKDAAGNVSASTPASVTITITTNTGGNAVGNAVGSVVGIGREGGTDYNLPPAVPTPITARLLLTSRKPPSSDTAPPTISLTAPVPGSTVADLITVTAVAFDPVVAGQATSGIAGIQLKLDGANLGTEWTASPWSYSWNTANTFNGLHTLAAVARDGAGNVGSSSPMSVIVLNTHVLRPLTQTLTAMLTATPAVGTSPLAVTLTARVSGTAQGSVNYTFYCDRPDAGTNITTPTLKYNNVASTTLTAPATCAYNPGTYTPKVIIEQGSAPPAESRVTVRAVAAPVQGKTQQVTTPAAVSLTRNLYRGLRDPQVQVLQQFLIQKRYLTEDAMTGYFGPRTFEATKQYQCYHATVCSGDEASTGWGVVGPKTRASINIESGVQNTMNTTSTPPLTDRARQTLQTQLNDLLRKLQELQTQAAQSGTGR